jgi:hypothetical protein
VLYVDDKLATHPKIFKAGAMLGDNGPALALALYMAGLSYTREHLTDGRIPDRIVAGCALVQRPLIVARVLADRRVRLWHRVRGGYLIHDYHDWNKKASEIKKKREIDRQKKAAQRNGKNGAAESLSLDVSPGDNLRTSRARASTTTIHVPRTTLELVPSGVRLASGTNLPTLARRPVQILSKTLEPKTPEATEHASAEDAQACGVASALGDHDQRHHGGTDDRRRGVEGADQESYHRARVDVSDGHNRHRSGDDAGRETARADVGITPGDLSNTTPKTSSGEFRSADSGGSRDVGEGISTLRATIAKLRADYRPHDGVSRRVGLTRRGTEQQAGDRASTEPPAANHGLASELGGSDTDASENSEGLGSPPAKTAIGGRR